MAGVRSLPLTRIWRRPISYCASIVRNYDRENYLCSLLLPEPGRSFAMALRAFNVELAQIRDRASKPEQAKPRFLFWREVVDGLFTSATAYDTPLVRELSESLCGLQLSKYLFLKLIEARERHFAECAFATLKAVERYAEDTNVSILYLICEAYGLKSMAVDHALSHLGRAQGLISLLRGSVSLAKRRRVVILPLDVMDKHNLNQELVLRLLRTDPAGKQFTNADEQLFDLFHDLASAAHQHASTASRLAKEALHDDRSLSPSESSNRVQPSPVFRQLFPRLMLPLIPAAGYLNRLAHTAHFDPRRLESYVDGLLPVRLSWYAYRNKIPDGPKP